LKRVAVVHASHSILGMASGMQQESNFLEFHNPDTYLGEIRGLVKQMEDDKELAYMPTGEMCLGRVFKDIALCVPAGQASASARPVWATTRQFLMDLSAATAEATEAYLESEAERTGVTFAVKAVQRKWRQHIVA
tara:strand:- start:104 stop:508 length:405 start_codon:yes stop_codon:yes gene_type:complete